MKIMNHCLKYCLALALSVYNAGYAFATEASAPVIAHVQQAGRKVKGTVVDVNGEPIIGANVLVKGTTNGMITDIDGNFTLEVPANAVLQVSYIGYITQEIKVSGKSEYKIQLKEDAEMLEEVVVVGYGTMKKKDLTGAVTSVKMNDEPVSTISTVSHALAGKAAGLQIRTTSAQPGGSVSMVIRGAASTTGNDPLIIIDGFPVSNPGTLDTGYYSDGSTDNVLGSINPNDIESIEVLKDASATAIYGARAGNGVILVTTKKGKAGKPQVKYSGTASVQKISSNYEMLSARDFMLETNRYLKEDWMRVNGIGIYGGASEVDAPAFTPRYSESQIANPEHATDWFDEITRNGMQTQHNISVTGGAEKTKYMVSGNYFKQNGILKQNDMERFTARVNLEQELSKYVNMGLNLTLSRNKSQNVPLGAGQSENASIMVSAAQFNPLLPIRDENGEYVMNPQAAFIPNPVSLLEATDKTNKERVLASAFVEIRPIKDLVLKANFGIDRNYQKRTTYLPITTLYGKKQGGKADVAQADKNDYLLELTANYTKDFKNHHLNVLGGYSFQSFYDESFGAGNNRFLTDGFLYNNLGAGNAVKPSVWSYASKSEMASFFGRLNYTFLDRYLVSATMRVDGSSSFAANHRWGYFPSVALGWRFSEEEFMKSFSNWLSNGKLRVSYGTTGNANIGYAAMSFYGVGGGVELGGVQHKNVYLAQLGNPDLKWESSREWNIGLDLGFFDSRVNVTAEYFHKVVSDLLSSRSLMSYQEIDKISANFGKTQSQGFELTINTNNIRSKDFNWNTDFTFSLYRDTWKERDPSWKPAAYQNYNDPLNCGYGYLSDGLVQVGENVPHMPGALPGQVKLKDIDGFLYNADGSLQVDKNGKPLKSGKPDGKLDDADKVLYGRYEPDFAIGFNNTLQWKRFDFNIYFYGSFNSLFGGDYKGSFLLGSQGVRNMNNGYNMPTSAKEIWSHDNPNGTRPSYFQDYSTWGAGDYYNQQVWYIRCRNITLGYNIPSKKGIFSNCRVYVDVNNPFVLTNYDGIDPETESAFYAYPNVRTYSVGIDLTF